MRRFGLRLAVMAAVVFSAGGPATAVDLTGQIVDYACYVRRGQEKGSGGLHANCAKACAQKGHRLAFVTLTGEAYLLVGVTTLYNNVLLLPLMNRQLVMSNVTVTQKTMTAETSEVVATDGRRGGSDPGVIEWFLRLGDFREGDPRQGVVNTIDLAPQDITRLMRQLK